MQSGKRMLKSSAEPEEKHVFIRHRTTRDAESMPRPANGLAVTGGGSGAISALLTVPGGSRTLLEAVVPYSSESQIEFLRTTPEHFCSPRTARLMAMAAFQRGISSSWLRRRESFSWSCGANWQSATSTGYDPIGVACTASLASDRPKRGAHRIHSRFKRRTKPRHTRWN